MKLNATALAGAMGLIFGAAMLLVGFANLTWPAYGGELLSVMSSIYPGYKASGSVPDLVTGALYALVDGGLFGLVLAWLYNSLAERRKDEIPVSGAGSERPLET